MNLNIPSGYTATFLGAVSTYDDMRTIFPLEEASEEGAFMLMRLDYAEAPSQEAITELELNLANAGVPKWPANTSYVYPDSNSLYIAWVKEIAWMGIIIGMLVLMILPALLGGLIWLLLPQSIKDMITMMVNAGIMILMILLMTKMMKPLMGEKSKPKQVKEKPRPAISRPVEYEEEYFTGEEV